VRLDDLTAELVRPFDYATDGTSEFVPFTVPDALPSDWHVGVIVGGSGTGKSLLLSEFGEVTDVSWDDELSIAAHFNDPHDALERLSAAGLMSVPDWVKPHRVLSNGQRFRADLARRIGDGAVVDEFTSVVDRNVARAASCALARFVRANDVRRMVLATVHRDILDWLEPDWVIDTDLGAWRSGRWLRRPDVVLDVYAASHEVWCRFAPHHYLDGSLNRSAHCYVAFWEGELVAFYSVIAYPSGTVTDAWRGHRLVVLPEYQGLGIGPRLSEAVAAHYVANGKRFFAKTAHPRLGGYRDASPLWRPTSKNHMGRNRRGDGHGRWVIQSRWAYSHEFIGKE
jgi:GNAT superfamily N-acetyltransferase